jgi:HD-GYP domain-containing protein (c-di-GMP phosphodiesterase class II)
MFRMALEYVEPGLNLGRDIFGEDGRIILAAGVTLSAKHIESLKRWDIFSVYIDNPLISIAPVEEVVAESVRLKAANMLKVTFEKAASTGAFHLSAEKRELVKSVIMEVLRKRLSIIHLAQIHRHYGNLFAHSMNVTILSTMTAVTIGISNSDALYAITMGALLHDIGMIAVPDTILANLGNLSDEEQEIYQNHTYHGFELLRKTEGVPLLSAHVALQHHEKYNGGGFPRKLSGNAINQYARIVAIADEYDKLIVDSPGKKGLAPDVAYESIVAGVNVNFDPEVAKAFLSKIAIYPAGTLVQLTTGDIGVVISATPKIQHRPVVEIIAGADSKLISQPFMMDLAEKENLTVFIASVVRDEVAAEFFRKNR